MASKTKRGQPPTLVKVLDIIGANFPSWYVLGVHMEMDDRDLDTIEANERDVRKQCIVMVQTWLRNSENPEWGVLYNALRKMGELALATRVSTQYCCEVTESEQSIPPLDDPSSQGVQPQVASATSNDPPPHSPARIQESKKGQAATPSQCTAQIPCDPKANVECLSETEKWKLSAAFSYLLLRLVQLLVKVDVTSLKVFLEGLYHPSTSQPYVTAELYRHCGSTAEVLRSLRPQYINVTHPYLLQEIVDTFGCEDSKKLMEEYNAKLIHIRSIPFKAIGNPLSDQEIDECHGAKRVKVIVEGDPYTITLQEIEQHLTNFERAIRRRCTFAQVSSRNSVALVFLMYESTFDVIIDLSKDRERLMELARCGFLGIESEDCTIDLTEDAEYWKHRILERTYGEHKEWDVRSRDSGLSSMSSSRSTSSSDVSVLGDASTKDDERAFAFAVKLRSNTTDLWAE